MALTPVMLTLWFVVIGLLLILMGLLGSVVDRLPLSTGLVYLVIGYLLGNGGFGLLPLDAARDSTALEHAAEVTLLVSLFSLGLKLRLPFGDPVWRIALRLATLSMLITIAGIAAFGIGVLGLPLAAALLLGAILAPTDPVLASDVQIKRLDDRDQVRFGLTAEGSMNDGTAFPFVFLGLGLLGLRDTGPWLVRWVLVDLVWAAAGGIAIGWICGLAVGRLVVFLRRQMREPIGLEEFLILGLVALSYGLALAAETLGFLAVLAAGIAVRRIEVGETKRVERAPAPAKAAVASETEPAREVARGLLTFNEHFERIGEFVSVLLLGALLSAEGIALRGVVLALALFVAIRPLSVWLGLAGRAVERRQVALIGWFGIRGVGSLYYLMFAINAGLAAPLAREITAVVLTVVAVSVVIHGVSATPVMARYRRSRVSR